MNDILDKYLEEIDPITGHVIIGANVALITQLTLIFIATRGLVKASQRQPKLEKKINDLLGGKWEVRKIKDEFPNAFVFWGKQIFITDKLIKLLSEKELVAVMLHEAYHVDKHHLLKHLAIQYPFFYIFMFVVMAQFPLVGNLHVSLFLAVLTFRLMTTSMEIPYRILISRKQENLADGFAVKYGYGDEIISALNKLEREYKRLQSGQKCGTICQAHRKINELLSGHPRTKERIEAIMKEKETWTTVASGSPAKLKSYFEKNLSIV